MIAPEDIRPRVTIRPIHPSSFFPHKEYEIVDTKSVRILGSQVNLVELRPKPTPPSGWVNAAQIESYFEIVDVPTKY